MTRTWRNNVQHIQSGEPVSAGVASRPDKALADRTEHLKDRLDATAMGRALFDVDATIAPDVREGQPVYWNPDNMRYELALAGVETDEASGTMAPLPSADVQGLLHTKKNSTLGDVVLCGIVKLPTLTNAIDGAITAGRYYLSAATEGKLVKQRPPVTVSVCFIQGSKDSCNDDPWVLVNPTMRDFLEDHIHYRFSLVCEPAGDHNPEIAAEDGRHTIENADDALQGWLPADHVIFEGKAPTGAVFGYNLTQHPQLQSVWPPVPLQAAAVLWDKGENLVGATEVPLGADGLVKIDANGIWWMSDCYTDVPWPATQAFPVSESSSSESSSSAPECPREEVMRVEVVFLRMVFGNDRSVVTSAKPATGSPITIKNCRGEDATTGDLEFDLNLEFLIDPDEVDGSLVFKEITPEFKFKRGRVVEGMIAGDASIELSGSVQSPVSEEDATVVHQGIVALTVNLEPTDRDLAPQIVRLQDAVERLYKDVPYLGFPASQDSLVRLRINVPPAGLPASPQMKIRTLILGRVAATLPLLTMTYRRLPQPVIGTPEALPTIDTTLTFASNVAVDVDEMVTVESEAFEVAAGDTVLVTIARDADAGYAGEVGIIRSGGVLLSG